MSEITRLDGTILTPNGWIAGRLFIEGQRIKAIEGTMLRPGETPKAPYILPGFVDLHVHGGNGADCVEGEESTRHMVRFHAENGTVAILPTTSTTTVENTEKALQGIANVMNDPDQKGADIMGAHLEGPFISAKKLGAQEASPLEGDVELAERWSDICPLRVATVAPEIKGGLEVIAALSARGTRVQVGHSIATEDELIAGFVAGLSGFTHLFNAMSPVDHKQSGIAGYALAHATHAEVVGDLRHVNPTTLLAAYRAIPYLYAITDAVGVAGLPDGEHATRGGRRHVVKKGLDIFLRDRPETRAGSAVTMADVFRCLASVGLPLEVVSAMTSTRAADYVGAPEIGRLRPGHFASIVVLDEALSVGQTIVKGRFI